jgi:5'-nucleotidase
MKKKLNILISNDDGYNSSGLLELSTALQSLGDVTIVAPKNQQSGVSSSLTFTTPLMAFEKTLDNNVKCYVIDGTPADCVKLAVSHLLDSKPDLVISGINHGRNTAINILYSGTVGGAIEGYLLGIPSIAVSINNHFHSEYLKDAAELTRDIIVDYILQQDSKTTPFLNVNIPDLPKEQIKGIKVTKIANTRWDELYEKRTAPYGWTYYWFAGKFEYKENDIDTDDGALRNDFISITPLKIDFFDEDLYKFYNSVKSKN